VIHAIWEFLWVAYHQGCQSWCLLCKKVRCFYRLPGAPIPADPEIAQVTSCHALPSILVLVLIPLDRNGSICASKLLRGGYHPMSIVFVWGEFLSVSWISLEQTGAEITLIASSDNGGSGNSMRMHTDQLTFAIAISIYEIDDQDIISNLMQCSLLQNSNMLLLWIQTPPFPHRPPTLAIIMVLSWASSGDSVNITFLSWNLIWFFYLGRMLVDFFGKAQFLSVSGLRYVEH